MKNTKTLAFFTEEEKKIIIEKIIAYFLDERNENIGIVAATNVLDFVEQDIAPAIYNHAVDAAVNSCKENQEELNFKLEELKKDSH